MRVKSQGDVMKGDFQEAQQDWCMSSKREVALQWTGATEDDFGLFLNGFCLDAWCFRLVSLCGSSAVQVAFLRLQLVYQCSTAGLWQSLDTAVGRDHSAARLCTQVKVGKKSPLVPCWQDLKQATC